MAVDPTNRLALKRPGDTSHTFSTQEYVDNLTTLDQFPGRYICTSGTHPVWSAAQAGMEIYETDRDLVWRWNGSVFVRAAPKGLLAFGQSTQDVSSSLTSYVDAVTISVPVPAINGLSASVRRIRLSAQWAHIENGTDSTLGVAELALREGSNVLSSMQVTGRPSSAPEATDRGSGGSLEAYWAPGAVAGGVYSVSLSFRSVPGFGGTTTITADASRPYFVSATEVSV